ncbi:hypothetical protein MMC30_004605 [Trapelia coarctata]|nr:hypothetical protein [Trapelia coarctata]
MATVSPPLLREALEKLPDHVNTVLIQIGKVFRDPSQRDPKISSQGRPNVHQAISKAHNDFHEALDVIEVELLKAKAVYERELALLHARRAEREKAAGALRLRAASQARTAILVDTLSASESAKANATGDESTLVEMEASTMTEKTSVPASTEPAKPVPISVSASAASEDTAKATTGPPSGPPAPDSISAPTPDLDHVSDLDFDSMFADTSVPDPSTNIDFDLDFSTSDNPFADLTSGNDFTVPNTSNMNGNGLANGTGHMSGLGNSDMGGDIDSLMPGIESYVNAQTSSTSADDIFASLDLPSAETGVGTALGDPMGSGPQKASKAPGIDFGPPDANGTTQADVDAMMGGTEEGHMESNFDDSFFDDGMEMGDGADMGNGEFGDMIDDWFNNA